MKKYIPKISTIVAICSILAFLGTGYGWIRSSVKAQVEREQLELSIQTLKTENKDQQDEIDELKSGVRVVNANLELLLTHFGITPTRTTETGDR
jgi:cell division protein FtsB